MIRVQSKQKIVYQSSIASNAPPKLEGLKNCLIAIYEHHIVSVTEVTIYL